MIEIVPDMTATDRDRLWKQFVQVDPEKDRKLGCGRCDACGARMRLYQTHICGCVPQCPPRSPSCPYKKHDRLASHTRELECHAKQVLYRMRARGLVRVGAVTARWLDELDYPVHVWRGVHFDPVTGQRTTTYHAPIDHYADPRHNDVCEEVANAGRWTKEQRLRLIDGLIEDADAWSEYQVLKEMHGVSARSLTTQAWLIRFYIRKHPFKKPRRIPLAWSAKLRADDSRQCLDAT
jgi:hypothetical protein